MAPLREFDLAVTGPEGSPPKLAATGAVGVTATTTAAATVVSTSSGSGSTPPGTCSGEAAAVKAVEPYDPVGAPRHVAGDSKGMNGGGGISPREGRPGLVSFKGANFRWTRGVDEDEHAKIFRDLMELHEKKPKVGWGGWDAIR